MDADPLDPQLENTRVKHTRTHTHSPVRFWSDTKFWLTFQELHVDVVSVDGDGVEALARVDVLLQAAGGPVAQQAGFSGSVQTKNQDLGPRGVQGSGLKRRQGQNG